MLSEDKIYSRFKSYQSYEVKKLPPKKTFNPKPLAGAALGVGAASLISLKAKGLTEAQISSLTSKLKNGQDSLIYKAIDKLGFKKNENNFLYKFLDKLHLKESGKKTFIDVSELIFTASCANIGSVALGSKGKTPEQKKIKRKEAAFQIMNMAIPMLMTTASLKFCESKKALNKVPTKIIGSFLGMTTGAFTATQITNLTKKENEEKRKYTIKDSIANFDDVVATIKIGFSEVEKFIPVSKILPFIYIYCASRAGSKGDEN